MLGLPKNISSAIRTSRPSLLYLRPTCTSHHIATVRAMPQTTSTSELNAVNSHTASQPSDATTDPSAPASSKRIFAPTSDSTSIHAEQYARGTLDLPDLDSDPLAQFHAWFRSATDSKVHQPETVCLSTASLPSGRVSSRYVYLKELDATGFVIYSNFGTSRKAADLQSNGHASLAFWWREVERQVRVEGRTERLTPEQSQVYFDTRIRESRIGAWASRQSEAIADRGVLEGWVGEEEKRWEGTDKVPVPEFWGGLRIVPESIEFWQGRVGRLHDRFKYTREESGEWRIERLSP